MNSLANKRILLGVTGGIAAYKSAELTRLLRRAGAEVRVVMTAAAADFITPLTLQALSGQPVYSRWDEAGAAMGHIELARWADRVLVAPATADTLARLAQGRADDLLSALCLATTAPLYLAPAMNQAMWRHAATRDNVETLRSRGVRLLGPAEGEQACGDTGPGRMLEPEALLAALSASFESGALAGLKVLVTAGPTREAIDPVRFMGNRSSGKMGYAVAAAAAEAGARVQLVSGPVALPCPPRVERVMVESAAEMLDAVLERVADTDIFVAAAAVADYRPQAAAADKIKKTVQPLTLRLEPAPDILATVSRLPQRPFCVGFAAETADLERHARKKRLAKSLDLVAANRVGRGLGFEADDNELHLFWEGGDARLARAPKPRLARLLIEHIAARYRAGLAHPPQGDDHADHTA